MRAARVSGSHETAIAGKSSPNRACSPAWVPSAAEDRWERWWGGQRNMVRLSVAFVSGNGTENEHEVCHQSCTMTQFPKWQREL